VLDLDVRGQDQDGDVREFRADLAGRVKTLGRVAGRHPDVHDHQLGPSLPDQREKARRIRALPDNLETGTLQQAGQALAQQDVVVSQPDPDRHLGHLHDYLPHPVSRARTAPPWPQGQS